MTKLVQFVLIHLTIFEWPPPEAGMSLEQQKVNLSNSSLVLKGVGFRTFHLMKQN